MPSYSPVFSSQFIVYTDAAPSLSFAVPPGFTAVIRDFTSLYTVAATLSQVTIQDSEEAPAAVVAQIEALGIEVYGQWTGRVVVPENGIISLVLGSLSAGGNVYVGGYLLRNTLT